MPTAEAYRTAVKDLTTAADSVATMNRVLGRCHDDFGFSGTWIADTVEQTLQAGRNNANGIGLCFGPLVDELNRRARLCDQYTLDMNSYRLVHPAWSARRDDYLISEAEGGTAPPPGPEPRRPEPPFRGAEVG